MKHPNIQSSGFSRSVAKACSTTHGAEKLADEILDAIIKAKGGKPTFRPSPRRCSPPCSRAMQGC